MANNLENASISILYVPQPPCDAVGNVVGGTSAPAPALLLEPVSMAASAQPCTGPGDSPDIAISDIDPDTCARNLGTPQLTAAGQRDVIGPVQVVTFVVPQGSSERSISADAAYVVFGFGASAYVVEPWSRSDSIFTPDVQSGPLNLVGTAIGLAPAGFANAAQTTWTATTALINALSQVANASAAIGILPSPIAESSNETVRVLAYQHTGQQCGYLPNSDADHRDKINVRQGRYDLWGPLHIVTSVDANGQPLDHTGQPNAALAAVIDWLDESGPAPGSAPTGGLLDASSFSLDAQSLVEGEAMAGLIPWCAMQVIRSAGALSEASYASPAPCGCSYENALGATTSTCMACRQDGDCNSGAPTCRFGFCEVQ
jgi:hypothetical protein